MCAAYFTTNYRLYNSKMQIFKLFKLCTISLRFPGTFGPLLSSKYPQFKYGQSLFTIVLLTPVMAYHIDTQVALYSLQYLMHFVVNLPSLQSSSCLLKAILMFYLLFSYYASFPKFNILQHQPCPSNHT